MSDLSFEPISDKLRTLLEQCRTGQIQVPEFQREWVWDEKSIVSLLDSVIKGYPIGTLMVLDTKANASFKYRQVVGASPAAASHDPQFLLIDGQQRMTCLYQAMLSETSTQIKGQKDNTTNRWFYIDIGRSVCKNSDREKIIFSADEKKSRIKYGKKTASFNLLTDDSEYENMMFPVSKMLDYSSWRRGFESYWEKGYEEKCCRKKRDIFNIFEEKILQNFDKYMVPIISIKELNIRKETICAIFEKVNTGGKALDTSELVTAMYAARGRNLREDWYGNGIEGGRKDIFAEQNISGQSVLGGITQLDFLQAISLLYTRDVGSDSNGENKRPQAVSAEREALLDLPLEAYQEFELQAQEGFLSAAKFLQKNNIFRPNDIPYKPQVISLAVILSNIKGKWQQGEIYDKLIKWYWRGIFSERYSSASLTKMAQDVVDVPMWLDGKSKQPPIQYTEFTGDKLISTNNKISAVYKGVNALIMKFGARDFILGQPYAESILFREGLNSHHIFPIKWCKSENIDESLYNSVVNRAPISKNTNNFLDGDAPSIYLSRVQNGSQKNDIRPVKRDHLDEYLRSHLIDPKILRTDVFDKFFENRKRKILKEVNSVIKD